jgi:hypothetical protein
MDTLSWPWIVLALTVPPLVGVLLAYPFWRRTEVIFGNIVGTAVMFGSAFGLILMEHVQLDRVVQRCLDSGTVCWPEPAAFTRFSIYAFIGLLETVAIFALSLKVEKGIRDRDYAPEWR